MKSYEWKMISILKKTNVNYECIQKSDYIVLFFTNQTLYEVLHICFIAITSLFLSFERHCIPRFMLTNESFICLRNSNVRSFFTMQFKIVI